MWSACSIVSDVWLGDGRAPTFRLLLWGEVFILDAPQQLDKKYALDINSPLRIPLCKSVNRWGAVFNVCRLTVDIYIYIQRERERYIYIYIYI